MIVKFFSQASKPTLTHQGPAYSNMWKKWSKLDSRLSEKCDLWLMLSSSRQCYFSFTQRISICTIRLTVIRGMECHYKSTHFSTWSDLVLSTFSGKYLSYASSGPLLPPKKKSEDIDVLVNDSAQRQVGVLTFSQIRVMIFPQTKIQAILRSARGPTLKTASCLSTQRVRSRSNLPQISMPMQEAYELDRSSSLIICHHGQNLIWVEPQLKGAKNARKKLWRMTKLSLF